MTRSIFKHILDCLRPRQRKLRGIIKSATISSIAAVVLALLFGFWWKQWVVMAWIATSLDLYWCVIREVPDNVFGVDWWDHYHWGLLVFLIVAALPPLVWLAPFGLHLFISEAFQDPPFSYGLPNFRKNVTTGLILAFLVLIVFFFL